MRALAFIHSPDIASLRYPPECPFDTSRATRMRDILLRFGWLGAPHQREEPARPAMLEEMERFHSRRYLEELQRASAGDLRVEALELGLGTPDTPVFRNLWPYAVLAAGASLRAADLLVAGSADIVFNPWGGFHHAMAEKAAGFCYVNDVVLACMRLAENNRRVLCLDVDAHHGDGTQSAFFERNDVMTISTHESGKTLFPWGGFEHEIGSGAGLGFNANLPLPADTYDDAYLAAFHEAIVPLIGAYNPDVMVVELGMDILAGDPLTHLRMTNNVVVELMHQLLKFDKPLLVTGGGGYHPDNTARGWALAWQTLSGEMEVMDMMMGMGGVMLESADWAGGLCDRVRPVSDEIRQAVEPQIKASVRVLKQVVFPFHGLDGHSDSKHAS